jgi:hypothetical protein
MKTSVNLRQSLADFFLDLELFQTKVVDKIKKHLIFNKFYRKSCRLWENVEKYGWASQATDDNSARSHCMLDN